MPKFNNICLANKMAVLFVLAVPWESHIIEPLAEKKNLKLASHKHCLNCLITPSKGYEDKAPQITLRDLGGQRIKGFSTAIVTSLFKL